ncbi:SDR family oxidoreductase [Patescibacteria group bacterium]|nr:SDR family oxidoreductase [Desulfobacteraceae bacterium]MBU4027152.1 SDR family oxidoreductase [Patescibacteria group bacterium]MBU4069268.1 SDR family oxidoreductase [Pseudomonadota bacterium]
MSEKEQTAIIIASSSDIGSAMARHWRKKAWNVFGTYRKKSYATAELSEIGVELVQCDLSDNGSVQKACLELRNLCPLWDNLILSAGSQEPIGSFISCNFDNWADSIQVNFTNQLRIVKELLPNRNTNNILGPCVLFFAGGGTNNATKNYSAYTISKIALIKMCELLDAEIPGTRFVIVGPGWVKTKIHQETLLAGIRAGENYERTKYRLSSDELTPMDEVLDCCDWLINSPRNVISGRNFSVVYDMWGTEELSRKLIDDFNMYKLRRHGNDIFVRK